MFSNIGKKIKTLAKVMCWIGIICSILVGLFVILFGSYIGEFATQVSAAGEELQVLGAVLTIAGRSSIPFGVLIMVVGSLVSWLKSFTLIGYGEIVEETAKIAANTKTEY